MIDLLLLVLGTQGWILKFREGGKERMPHLILLQLLRLCKASWTA